MGAAVTDGDGGGDRQRRWPAVVVLTPWPPHPSGVVVVPTPRPPWPRLGHDDLARLVKAAVVVLLALATSPTGSGGRATRLGQRPHPHMGDSPPPSMTDSPPSMADSLLPSMGGGRRRWLRSATPSEMADLEGIKFFTIILEKSSSRQVLPHNFVKMLDGHQPRNMKLWQAGNRLRRMWDVEVVFDTDGSMYLDRGWKQFVRAYDLQQGYFLVFRYDGNAMFTVKDEEEHSGEEEEQSRDDEVVGDNGLAMVVVPDDDLAMVVVPDDDLTMVVDPDDGLAMVIPQLGDMTMPIVVEEYIPQRGLRIRCSKHIRMMKEKGKKQ
ncbi:B3 domain-containing protein [Hordeum vulgare]|nr:B3 domain-containing protein [Hordeum vulgare]